MNTKSFRSSTAIALLVSGALLASVGCSKTDTQQTAVTGSGSTAAPATSPPATSAPATSAPNTSAPRRGTTSSTASDGTSSGDGTTSSTAKSATDQKAAEASLITTADMPAGFSPAPPSTSSSDANPFLGIPACAPFQAAMKASDDQRTAKAKAQWKNAAKDEIDNSVEIYSDVKVAQDSAQAIADPGFATCIEAAFKAAVGTSLPAGASIDSLKATTVDAGSASQLAVDSATSFKVAISMSVQGQSVDLALTVTMLTSGRALSQVSSQVTGTSDLALAPAIKAAAVALTQNAPS